MLESRRHTRLLVVEDDPDLRELLRLDFELAGYQTRAVGSGRLALEHLSSLPTDVVVSDIRMPDGDGVFLLKELRRRGEVGPLVYLITGYADIKDQDLMLLGCMGIFQKPFDIDELMTTIDRDFAARRAA